MGIKYSRLLIILLLPALICGASAEIYVENASVTNITLNAAPLELINSLNGIHPRIFIEDVDSLNGQILIDTPVEFDNLLNAVRPRIFTEEVDSVNGRNLKVTPAQLNSSLNAVRPRIFIEQLDSLSSSKITPFFLSPPSNNSTYVDTDKDGVIDVWDRENNTTPGFWVNPLGIGRMLGDMNGNGILDSGDVTILMQKIVGMMT